jgi:hypothetical protein
MGIHIHLIPALVAAVVMWVIGALWYGVFFKKRWMSLVGDLTGKRSPVFDMVCSFILGFVLCVALSNMIALLGTILWSGHPGFTQGYSIGIMCWFGFIAPPMLTQSLHEKRPVNLFVINMGYWVVSMAFAGGVAAVLMK